MAANDEVKVRSLSHSEVHVVARMPNSNKDPYALGVKTLRLSAHSLNFVLEPERAGLGNGLRS
jgi:hypothetical protein